MRPGAGGWQRLKQGTSVLSCKHALAVAGLVVGYLAVINLAGSYNGGGAAFLSLPCSRPDKKVDEVRLQAILHYATSSATPQQTRAEIGETLAVLTRRCAASPCNLLVFGLGHDSLMWAAFNARGATLFLEEDPEWVRTVLAAAPGLRAEAVRYSTRLSEADSLLAQYRSEPSCLPPLARVAPLGGRCRLALGGLPAEVYEREWDLIMIDAPRGYAPAQPGRMAAIYSAGVMARARKGGGTTHVFLHDVDRKVEKEYAEEFLCRKNRVGAVGRLWHFEISPVVDWEKGANSFC